MKPVLSESFRTMKEFTSVVQVDDSTELDIFTEIGQHRIRQSIIAAVYRKERVMRDRWRFALNPLRIELAGTEWVEESRRHARTILELDLVLNERTGEWVRRTA